MPGCDIPVTTWRTARRELADKFGLVKFKTTTDINNDDQVVSTDLQSRYVVANHFKGWFATVILQTNDTGNAPENGLGTTTKRVEVYTETTGALTCAGAAWADEGTDDVDVDLYNTFHPDDYLNAYNRARQLVYPRLVSYKDHKGIITDRNTLVYPVPQAVRNIDQVTLGRALLASHPNNLFTDGGFEDWASATSLTNWTLTTSLSTVNQEVATSGPENHMVLTGQNSARLHARDSTTLLETLTPDVAIQGVYVVIAGYVYCRTASSVALQIDSDVDTASNGSFHGGTGWEWLSHEFKIGDTAGNIIAGVYVDGGTTQSESYLDRLLVWAGPMSPPEGAWDTVHGYKVVPALDGASNGGTIELPVPPRDHDVLRINGRGLLSSVSVDTDTIEIDGELLEPLYLKTWEVLCERKARQDGSSDWAQRAIDFKLEYNEWFRSNTSRSSKPVLAPTRRSF